MYLNNITIKQGLSYLESKNNMLLIYSIYMTYYALLKSQGKLINSHPVIKKLIYLKYLIEKTKNIDTKLKPQIDKLIKLAESVNEDEEKDNKRDQANSNLNIGESKVYRPQLLDEDNEEDMEEDEGDDKKNAKKNKNLKYKVESNLLDFYETKNEDKLRKTKIEKLKKKIRSSEMYKNLKNEASDNPLEFKNNNTRVVRNIF